MPLKQMGDLGQVRGGAQLGRLLQWVFDGATGPTGSWQPGSHAVVAASRLCWGFVTPVPV